MVTTFFGLRKFWKGAALCAIVLILSARTARAQTFSQPANISGNVASSASYPDLVVDAVGNINVAWVDSVSAIQFARLMCNGQPAWIQCAFNPASLNSGSTSAVMTVTVISAPTVSRLNPIRALPAQRTGTLTVTFAAMCVLALAIVSLRGRQEIGAAVLLRGFAVMALTLVLAVGLISCGGAAGPSSAVASGTAVRAVQAPWVDLAGLAAEVLKGRKQCGDSQIHGSGAVE